MPALLPIAHSSPDRKLRSQVDGELMLFESTALGVGRCPIEFYVNSFYWNIMSSRFHTIAIRRLYTNGTRGITPEMRRKLLMYQDSVIGHGYKKNPLQYIRPLLDIPQKEDFSSLFCSELIAGAYKARARERFLSLTHLTHARCSGATYNCDRAQSSHSSRSSPPPCPPPRAHQHPAGP